MAKVDVAANEAQEADKATVAIKAGEVYNAKADELAKAVVADGAHKADETD